MNYTRRKVVLKKVCSQVAEKQQLQTNQTIQTTFKRLYKPAFCLILLLHLSGSAFSRTVRDSVPQSRLLRFAVSGSSDDSNRAVLQVYIREQGTDEPVLGATVLLQRFNPDQVHGKVSQWDGRCKFKVAPGIYQMRVQLTGMVTYFQEKIELLPGQQYDMELELARMRPPVPSPKQQDVRNGP